MEQVRAFVEGSEPVDYQPKDRTLRDLVHDVDVVHPLAPVPVTQMDGVHSKEVRLAVQLGRLANPDRHQPGPRILLGRPLRR